MLGEEYAKNIAERQLIGISEMIIEYYGKSAAQT